MPPSHRGSAYPHRLQANRPWPRPLVLATCVALSAAVCLLATAAGAAARTPRPQRVRAQRTPASVQNHVETWAYDDGCNGGIGASGALVRRWVTYAEMNCGPNATKGRTDCHVGGRVDCYVMQYLDTFWDFTGQPQELATIASGNWWLHAPPPNQGERIYSDTFGGGYLMNQADPAVQAFFRSYVREHYDADDGLLMDWQSASLSGLLWYSSCSCDATSEIPTDAALQHAHAEMSAALTHQNGRPFIQDDNSLAPNSYLPQGFNMLDPAIGVDGLDIEGSPIDDGTLDPYYSTLLDQIAYVANRTSGFVSMLSRAPAGAPYLAQSRRVQEATMLIGYRPGHLVDWADLEVGSGDLAVWPEEGIYPTSPVQSMRAPGGRGCLRGLGIVCTRGGHNNVQVAAGIYRREFRACYLQRARFGRCAAIINTTGHPVTVRRSWLRQSYRHQITLNGADVQSGGTVSVHGARFAAGSTTLAPDDAMLLAQ